MSGPKSCFAYTMLLCSILLGCQPSPTPSNAGDADIVGTWYIKQVYGNEWEALRRVTPSITLRPDGSYIGIDMVGGQDEGTYEWNARDNTITITEEGRTGTMRVAFVDDVMLMSRHDIPEDNAEEWEGVVLEFSRQEAGNERHQIIHRLQANLPLPSEIEQSNENLRELISLLISKYEDDGVMPSSLGELAISGEVEIDRLFVPWIRHREPLPKTFNSLSREKQVGWLSTYSSYTWVF